MTPSREPPRSPRAADTAEARLRLLADLHEVVAALDKRTVHPERASEQAIADQASALRREAIRRIGDLERADPRP